MNGKLIVFEGTDGSGKATQAKLLCETLADRGLSYREIDFPRYGSPFAEPANLYLHGALGNKPGDVNAYAASVLYAVDRFASYKEDWGGFYEEGGMFYSFLYATTEPVISPVRSVLSRTKLFDSLPIDLSSIFTWILLMLVRMILTSI